MRGWLGPKRIGRTSGWVGGALVAAMMLVCAGSLPWTAARTSVLANADASISAAGAESARPRLFELTQSSAGLLPPWWASHRDDERARLKAHEQATAASLRPWLGTDRLGRDLLARCLVGGVISLTMGLASALIAVTIGTIVGMIAGYFGGRVDALLMRIVDVLYGLPTILIVVLLAVGVEGWMDRQGGDWSASSRAAANLATLVVAVAGVSWLTTARVIRGQVLSLRRQPFMEATVAIGVPVHRQFLVHLLPNLAGPMVVYATLAVPTAILAESFMSFLGIGVREPWPSWGNLAAGGLSELNMVRSRWWLLVFPCVLIGITLVGLNLMGEAIRERLDPKR